MRYVRTGRKVEPEHYYHTSRGAYAKQFQNVIGKCHGNAVRRGTPDGVRKNPELPSRRRKSCPPEVGVVVVQPQRVSLTMELPGRTSPHLIAEVRPQVSGIIQKRLFTEGTDVKAGQVLYQIDPGNLSGGLRQRQGGTCQGRGQCCDSSAEGRALQGSGKDQGGQPAGL